MHGNHFRVPHQNLRHDRRRTEQSPSNRVRTHEFPYRRAERVQFSSLPIHGRRPRDDASSTHRRRRRRRRRRVDPSRIDRAFEPTRRGRRAHRHRRASRRPDVHASTRRRPPRARPRGVARRRRRRGRRRGRRRAHRRSNRRARRGVRRPSRATRHPPDRGVI